jgi:hypothetical protein
MLLIITATIRLLEAVSGTLFRASIWIDTAVLFLRTRR